MGCDEIANISVLKSLWIRVESRAEMTFRFPSWLGPALTVAMLTACPVEGQLFKKRKQKNAEQQPAPRPAQIPLQPGEYEWHPEKSPSGPLLIVVSIDDQLAYVYRNGVQIARSTVSTGRPGKETPTGVFTILQKNKDHESNIYEGAKMPNMQRLTWSGIAMHAGDLPGYPASAGCVRLPVAFSEKLFAITEMGGTVVITQRATTPSTSDKPASILLSSNVDPGSRPDARFLGRTMWDPKRSPTGPVNFLLSGKDRTLYVYRNGVLIGQTPVHIRDPQRPIPGGVFLMLEGTLPGQNTVVPGRPIRPWSVLTLHGSSGGIAELRDRLSIPPDFGRTIYELAKPGTIVLSTPDATTPQTQSGTDFTIMTPGAAERP